jgi:glycosyltransferase involved in cell wall biosynthesis
LLEALAAGKAVVASPLAAAGLSVTGGEQLVLADSDEEFIAAIITLLDDDQRRRQLGAAARLWAEQNLGWDSRVSAYEDLYRALLGGKARSNPAAGTASASSLVGQLDQ